MPGKVTHIIAGNYLTLCGENFVETGATCTGDMEATCPKCKGKLGVVAPIRKRKVKEVATPLQS